MSAFSVWVALAESAFARVSASVAAFARSGVAAEVSCLGDLAAEVDAHTECTTTDPATGEERTWRIVVTSVEDDTVQFAAERAD